MVEQTGEFNYADVDQFGSNQFSRITQSSPTPALSDTVSGAIVRQDGADNVSIIDQSGEVALTRFGLGFALPNGRDDLSPAARVVQQGNRNRSTVDQSGISTLGFVDQIGDDNISVLTQDGQTVDASLLMFGDGNVIRATQSTTSAAPEEPGAGLQVSIFGERNRSVSVQDGTSTSGTTQQQIQVIIVGNDNLSNVTQSGTDERAEIIQRGDFNTSVVRQEAGGLRNDAQVDQTGDEGSSLVRQLGTDNFAELNQDGLLNESVIVQNGALNSAKVGQASAGNVSSVRQIGSANMATINQ